MGARKIRQLFKALTDPLIQNKSDLINQFASGYQYDVNDKAAWQYPLVYLQSEIVLRPGASATQQWGASVTLQLLTLTSDGDREYKQTQLFDAKAKLEMLWQTLENGLRTIDNNKWGVWYPNPASVTLIPLEYAHQDGVTGYQVDLALNLIPDGNYCSYEQAAGIKADCLGCDSVLPNGPAYPSQTC